MNLNELFTCCGSKKWAEMLSKASPQNAKTLVEKATAIWYNQCSEKDWLEAFSHHPKIGDVNSLRQKYAGEEQSGTATASSDIIEQLAKANEHYQNKFGFIFIVCATGKSAAEMLQLLQERLKNSYEEELLIAMGEQHKITIIRFKKLFPEEDWKWLRPGQLTTHVLDTSVGKPGKNISIRLQAVVNNKWTTIAQGITNEDGRIGDLLPPERILRPSNYKLAFDTEAYFQQQKIKGFYPLVEIQFSIADDLHYHVPLLINPFGYSTYRGS